MPEVRPAAPPTRRRRPPHAQAFELDALGSAANVRYQLDGDAAALERADRAIRERLRAVAR